MTDFQSVSLVGRVAIVTGAGGGPDGGMGAGIARCLARRGAAVVVNDLDAAYAERTVAQLKAMGAEALAVVADVAVTEQVQALVDTAYRWHGRLDIVVNNAGIGGRVPAIERLPNETWWRTIAVDLTGPFKVCRAALPHMQAQRWGRVINIASMAALRTGFVSGAPYTAAKSGLLGLTRHLAMEVGPWGITVNAVLPGGTLTPAMRRNPRLMEPEVTQSLILGRWAEPEDIGEVVAFLASPAAGYVSGVALPVDGAMGVLAGDFSGYKEATGKDAG